MNKPRRNERFAIRLTRAERQTLERLAFEQDATASQLLRQALKKFAVSEGAATK